jgi:hypothetical protein
VDSILIIENGNIRGVGQEAIGKGCPRRRDRRDNCKPRGQIRSAGADFQSMEILAMTLSCLVTLEAADYRRAWQTKCEGQLDGGSGSWLIKSFEMEES